MNKGKGYKTKIIELLKTNKSYNEIKEIVGCSKSLINYYANKEGIHREGNKSLSEEIIININLLSKNHSNVEIADLLNISLRSVNKYKKEKRIPKSKEQRKKDNVKYVHNRRLKNKELLVEYKGGKCINCGYNKCIGALEFHHRNPKEKEFGLSSRGLTKSLEKMKKEADKCDLLCANCHRELHWE